MSAAKKVALFIGVFGIALAAPLAYTAYRHRNIAPPRADEYAVYLSFLERYTANGRSNVMTVRDVTSA